MSIKFLDMEQDGDDWLNFRNAGIGSSDVSLLVDPKPSFDRTVGALWNDRVGYEKFKFVSNIHTERGKRLEGYVRDRCNAILGNNFQPVCVMNTAKPYLRASLDGYDPEHNSILEIKNPSDKVADKYLKDWTGELEVPFNYYLQIQYQLLVSGADYAYYSFYNERWADPYIKLVERNVELIADIEKRCGLFWGAVESRTPIGFDDNGNLKLYPIVPSCYAVVCDQDFIARNKDRKFWIPIKSEIQQNAGSFICLLGEDTSKISSLKKLNPYHKFYIVPAMRSQFSLHPQSLEDLV